MKKVQLLFLSVFLTLILLGAPAFAKTASDIPTYTDNVDAQNYSVWASPVHSHLIKTSSGYERLEYNEGKIIHTTFDESFTPIGEDEIAMELPLFGGFYNGKDNYYIFVGQNNEEEDDSKEVIRVIKYDKNWKRLGSGSLYGANTIHPFDAGSLRAAEYGDYLYVRTCHEMYTSQDGLNHQANVSFVVYTPSMEITDQKVGVENSGGGYVSHSFNQFIIVDNDDIVALDHGDAYPRSALLGRYDTKAGQNQFMESYHGYTSTSVLSFYGNTGDNSTNASLGGLEASRDNYLTVGNSTDQQDFANKTRNVYLTVTPKSSLDNNANTEVKWLTNLTSTETTTTPHLVKFDDDNFLVLWSQRELENPYGPETTYYAFVDGSGQLKGSPTAIEAQLSDCKPIVSDDTAYWYVSDTTYSPDENTTISLYGLKNDGTLITNRVYEPVLAEDLEVSPQTVSIDLNSKSKTFQLQAEITPKNSTDDVTYTSQNPDIAEVDENGLITGVGPGATSILVCAGNITKTVEINVVIPATDINIKDPSAELNLRDGPKTLKVEAVVVPENSTDKLTYSSSDTNIVEIDVNGKITVRGPGKTVVKVTAGKITKSIEVNVLNPATDITIANPSVELALGNESSPVKIDTSIVPSDSTDTLVFTSDDPNIVEVDSSGLMRPIAIGKGSVKVTAGDISKTIAVTVEASNPIYRLYNSHTGEHLYTPSSDEVAALTSAGWEDEGTGWNVPQSGTPVYRLFNPEISDHLYTSDENEKDILTRERGWTADFGGGPVFYSSDSGTSIYRLYNDGNKRHLLTRDEYEYNVLPSQGWAQEGVAFYGLSQ